MDEVNKKVGISWEEINMLSFTKIDKIVKRNIDSSTLRSQLHENKFITALFLSQLAYFKFSTISSKLSELGAKKISLYDNKGTQGYLAELEDIAVVSFRGTQLDKKDDLYNVLTFWKYPFQTIKVHKGFITSFEDLIPGIVTDLNHIDRSKRLVYVGHSMGGALATLLSIAHKPDELCTFGSPRVACKTIEPFLEGVECNRIVTKYDWIRFLPPNIPFILPYKHVGVEHVLPSNWDWRKIVRPHLLITYLQALLDSEFPEHKE